LPRRLMWWKKGKRGSHLYYVLWQFSALRVARRLPRSEDVDIVWHVTIANVWQGSTAPLTGLPFVFGPVGGGIPTTWRLLPALGTRGALHEVARSVVRGAFRFLNPLCALALRR